MGPLKTSLGVEPGPNLITDPSRQVVPYKLGCVHNVVNRVRKEAVVGQGRQSQLVIQD